MRTVRVFGPKPSCILGTNRVYEANGYISVSVSRTANWEIGMSTLAMETVKWTALNWFKRWKSWRSFSDTHCKSSFNSECNVCILHTQLISLYRWCPATFVLLSAVVCQPFLQGLFRWNVCASMITKTTGANHLGHCWTKSLINAREG